MEIEMVENEPDETETPEVLQKNGENFTDEPHETEDIQEAEIIFEQKIRPENREPREDAETRVRKILSILPENGATRFQLYRMPDHDLAGTFRVPCSIKSQCEPVYWDKTGEPESVYASIQRLHGGGIYEIKPHSNEGYIKDTVWYYTVPDPEASNPSMREQKLKKEKDALNPKPELPPIPPAPVVNPAPVAPPAPDLLSGLGQIVSIVEAVDKIKTTFAPVVSIVPAAPSADPPPPQNSLDPEKQLLLEIYNNSGQPELKNKIVNAMIGFTEPPVEQQPSFWQHAFDTLINGAANSEGFQDGAKELASAVIQLGTAYVTSKILPAPAETANAPLPPFPPIPPVVPSTTPGNTATPPATEQTALIVAPLVVPDLIPEINLEGE